MTSALRVQRIQLALIGVGLVLAVLTLVGQGCPKKAEPPATDTPPTTTPSTVPTETTPIEETTAAAPGEIPYDYPTVATTAQAGDIVLAPSRDFLDAAFEDPSSTFIFYDAAMATPGAVESTIETPFESVQMPNSLIIPIEGGQTAEPGDIILTWWQTGSGMQRAMVVEGGTPDAPRVMYLDLDWDNPATTDDGTPIAQAEYDIEADTFHVLSEAGAPGTAVAYKEAGSSEYSHGIVINRTASQVLVSGFAGQLAVADAANVVDLPIEPVVAVGDSVWVPVIGTFSEGTVTEVNTETGRVTVEYDFAGSSETALFPFGDVAPAALLQ
jgi:hypothetical protein